MPKTKISEYSTTNADNTDIEGINIAEGCAPSGINNAIRELMVHLKEFETGSSGDSLTVGGNLVVSNNVTISGNVTVGALIDPAITGTIKEDVYTITDGAAFEIDPGNGSVQLITLGASRTPKATNFAAGEAITLMVDDGTAYTLTWTDATFGGSGVVWKTDGGVAPTLNTTGYTAIVLWKVSTQVYGARVGDA
jgi:hypothetical protein